ncbi:PcfJ domain-containing protein [Streptomyces sp. NPDC007083]|uniref:PcfJ domain-containing protein n=1 Tax=Streptomyces sp. NPDC007083 TaxID=3156913 RepID=UPI0033FEF5A3
MSENNKRVLLHIKFLLDNDQVEPTVNGVITGSSFRCATHTAPDGRVTVSGTVSHRIHRMRASGKVFRYWQIQQAFSLLRTKADLVVLRVRNDVSGRRHNNAPLFSADHLFSGNERRLGGLLRRLGQAPLAPLLPYESVRVVGGSELQGVEWGGIEAQMTPIIQNLNNEVLRLIGDLPLAEERFPLLKTISPYGLAHSGGVHYLDAEDYKTVAEAVFGKTRYRKPLAREIQRLTETMHSNRERHSRDMSVLNWFRLFRGLVPIDWITESMRRTETNHPILLTSAELVQARALFRRVPQPVLGRILAEPVAQNVRIIKDTVHGLGNIRMQLRNLDLLPELIKARGQRRIRGARGLETLVRSIPVTQVENRSLARSNQTINVLSSEAYALYEMQSYNRQITQLEGRDLPAATWELWKDPEFRKTADEFLIEHRRELMTAEQRRREEQAKRYRQERLAREQARAAWAVRTTEKLDGVRLGEYRLVVARNSDTLTRWGSQLNNCIAGYEHKLGFDVFVGVLDGDGRVRLNIEINHENGIMQFLGTNNRDAFEALGEDSAQQVLDALTYTGIPVDEYAIGLEQLTLPARDTVAV